MKNFILDSNVIMHDPDCIFEFDDNKVIILFEVLEDLDKYKSSPHDVGNNVRKAIRTLDDLRSKGHLNKGVKLDNGGVVSVMSGKDHHAIPDKRTKDGILLATAKTLGEHNDNPVIIVTKNVNLRVKADAVGIGAVDYEKDKGNYDYTGHDVLDITSKQLKSLEDIGHFHVDPPPPIKNEYFRFTCEGENVPILGKHVVDGCIERIFTSQAMKIKARNIEQEYALNALMDDDIKFVTLQGQAGCNLPGNEIEIQTTSKFISKDELMSTFNLSEKEIKKLTNNKLITVRKSEDDARKFDYDIGTFDTLGLKIIKLSKGEKRMLTNDKSFVSKYLKLEYWLRFNEIEDAIQKTKFCRNHSKYFDINESELVEKHAFNPRNLTETILRIQQWLISSFMKIKHHPNYNMSCVTQDFWTFRGWTKDEAKNKISKIQETNSKLFFDKYEKDSFEYKSCFNTTEEFYVKRGFSPEEAKEILTDRQDTNSIYAIMQRENCSIEEAKQKILERKTNKFGNLSKEALEVFNRVYVFCKEEGISSEDIYFGNGDKHEYFISETKNGIRYYDFTIRSKKLIIEYNCTAFHPRNNDTSWTSAYGVSYEDQHQFDVDKLERAKRHGFKVLVIWSDDENALEKCQNFIKENI